MPKPRCFGNPPCLNSNNHNHNDANTMPTFWIVFTKKQHHCHCTIHHHLSKCQKPTCKYAHLKVARLHFGLSNEPLVGQHQTGCNLVNISKMEELYEGSRAWGITYSWVDGVLLMAEIWRSPVEVGSLSPLITEVFIHHRWRMEFALEYTRPKTSSLPLKMEGWKMKLPFASFCGKLAFFQWQSVS